MTERNIGLYSGCILDTHDGIRISSMSRHTLNDGKTPHPQINENSFDYWMQELAPPDLLIARWYATKEKNKITWEQFEKYYRLFLTLPKQREAIFKLLTMSKQTRVTVMCIEETPEFCHRRILLEVCQKIAPEVPVEVG